VSAVYSLFKALNWTVDDVNNSHSSSAMHLEYIVKTTHRACAADQGVYNSASFDVLHPT